MNTWSIIDGDIVLSSDNEAEMQFANGWILHLVQQIRQQTIEELENGRTNNGPEQLELPEVTC
jgi:hypothetical protein